MTSFIYDTLVAPLKVASDKTQEYLHQSGTKQPDRIFESSSTISKFTSLFSNPVHIVNGIYLGNAVNAASYYKLIDMDVGLIINVTQEIKNYYEGEFEYLKFDILDNGKDDLTQVLIESYQKIKEYKDLHPFKTVMVHCYMGASRSVSVIIYFLMKEYSKTFDEAMEIIRKKKNIANISVLFKKNICELVERQTSIPILD